MSQQPARRNRRRRRNSSRRAANNPPAAPAAEASANGGNGGKDDSGGRRNRGQSAGTGPPKKKDTIFGMPRLAFSLIAGLLVAMIAVFAMQLIFPGNRAAEVEGVELYPDQGRRQLQEGELFAAYNSFPPTSGPLPHAPAIPEAAAYDLTGAGGDCSLIAAPSELLPVLSRGGIVIYYDSAIDPAALSAWYDAQRLSRPKLALAPIQGLRDQRPDGAGIVAAAWRTLLPVQAFDDDGRQQLDAFIQFRPDGYYDRYMLDNTGIPPCETG